MVIEALVKTVLSELGEIAKTKTVVGEPIQLGETTIVPVSKLSIGFAVGGGNTSGELKQGEATGGGASIEPVAFFVARNDKVELVTVQKEDVGLAKFIDLVPQIVDQVKGLKQNRKKSEPSEEKKTK